MSLRPWLAAMLLGTVGACAPVPTPVPRDLAVPDIARNARVVATSARIECVPYARQISGVAIRGDAWTWWASAKAGYRRGHRPEPGAVMVFKRQRGSQGHLAVVARVIGSRLVLVDHANWLNRGDIHKATPVIDVSKAGDWSEVRVWHTPNRHWGTNVYRVYGFVYPSGYATAKGAARAEANATK